MPATKPKPRVALVYPPYGPLHLPSLGLALLSAGVQARGFDCRTFYWNLLFTHGLPGGTLVHKQHLYRVLSLSMFSPWNEWLFMKNILPERLARKDGEVFRRLARLDVDLGGTTYPLRPSQLILGLCTSVGDLLGSMADQLEPFDIVGIGTTFSQNGAAVALAKRIKDRWPEKRTVLGGANCDGEMGRALIENFPFLDYVFSGEVDHDFPEFVQRLHEGASVADIHGIVYRDWRGRIEEGPRAAPLADLNGLPTPDFADYIAERKRYGFFKENELCLPLESSRGCWWGAKSHCTFCGLNANGMAYRQKDAERFQHEVETIVERYRTRYLFMADNILSAKYYRDFVQWAKERKIGVEFFYEIKSNVNRQQVEDLAAAGITTVQPGIESFSTKTLSLMKKGVRGVRNVWFLKLAREYGINTTWNILGGFPGEDPSEYERMSRQLPTLAHLQPPYYVGDIEFHRFSPYHNDPRAFGIRLRPHEKYFFIYPFEEECVARLAYVFELADRAPRDLSYLDKLGYVAGQWRQQFDDAVCTLTWEIAGTDILIKDRRPGFLPRNYRLQEHAVAAFKALDQPRPLRDAVQASIEIESSEVPAASLVEGEPWTDVHRRTDQPGGERLAGGQPANDRQSVPIPAAGSPRARRWTQADTPEQRIFFTDAEFSSDPYACLKPLLEAGLLFEDDGWYLALPVREDYRRLRQVPEALRSTLDG